MNQSEIEELRENILHSHKYRVFKNPNYQACRERIERLGRAEACRKCPLLFRVDVGDRKTVGCCEKEHIQIRTPVPELIECAIRATECHLQKKMLPLSGGT